jgi:hypothetical protein
MLRDLLLSLAIVAQAVVTPAPSPSASAVRCRPDNVEVRQTVTYPDKIEIPDASLATFRRYKPRAHYGVIVMFTYLDGHVVAKSADRPEFDAAFRQSLLRFGAKLVAAPVIAGCGDVIGGVFLMMFTIPDGRVHVEPITAKDAATTT